MKKTVVYALILSAVSVSAGLVAGVAIERAKIKKHLDAIRPHQPFPQEMRRQPPSGGGPKELFQRLAKELNLDEGQKQEFKAIFRKGPGRHLLNHQGLPRETADYPQGKR